MDTEDTVIKLCLQLLDAIRCLTDACRKLLHALVHCLHVQRGIRELGSQRSFELSDAARQLRGAVLRGLQLRAHILQIFQALIQLRLRGGKLIRTGFQLRCAGFQSLQTA